MKTLPLILISAGLGVAQNAGVFTQTRAANGAIVSRPPAPSSFDCSADGTVVNAVTGEAIARAHVNVTVGGTTYSANTDTSGMVDTFQRGLCGGPVDGDSSGFSPECR